MKKKEKTKKSQGKKRKSNINVFRRLERSEATRINNKNP